MARFGFSVEKTTLFRAFQQPFANVYYYEVAGLSPTDTAGIEDILDHLVVREKTIHSSAINFVHGRAWNTGSGSSAGNQMRVDKDYSGAGAKAPDATMDKERAILIRIPAGTNSRGKPVYLRKWYHTNTNPTVAAFATAVLANTGPMSAAQKTEYANFMDSLVSFSDAATAGSQTFGVADLCSQTGRDTTGGAQCHDYLEHHQLGDQWR
jgi:hypothetical protein